MSVLKFNCGCAIPVIDGAPQIDYYNLNLECPKTWATYQTGYTQSIFQLESYLGKMWSKKLKPSSIADASALISIIRPGTLEAQNEAGESLTKVYCDRSNDKWKACQTNVLEKLLEETYGINIYQESSMVLAAQVAGFDGAAQMKLIKGIGKKNAELLFSLRKEFISGCKKVGKVNEAEMNAIFDNIEASARYAFNKCILGSEKLKQCSKGSNKFHPSIEELYKITTDINYAKSSGHLSLYKKNKLNKCFGFALSMCEDNRIRKNKIINIQEAGIRQTLTITTKSGKKISVTDNHNFPTPNGKQKADDLKIDDELYICGEYEKNNSKKYNFSPYSNDQIKQMRKNGGGKIPHGNFKLFASNKKILKSKNVCSTCESTHNRLEIHHINGDRTNNRLKNLTLLCPSCHKKIEYTSGRLKRGQKGYPVLTEKIVKIELGPKAMTYDITMEAPNHNYVTSENIITCNSHAVSYAVTGYWTAWVKSHLPKHYICSWLRNAKNEQKPLEEIRAVISEARRLGIRVLPPSIKNLPHTNFFIKKDAVHFGLDSIKGCGEKGLAKLLNLNIDFDSISWLDFLVQFSDKITKTQVINMIRSGCFDCYFISRTEAEFQYNSWITVCNTPAAKAAAASLYNQHKPKTIRELFSLYHNACNLKKKKDSISDVIRNLDNPSYSLEDSKSLIIEHEKALLGINVTCSAVSKSSIPTVKDYCNTIDKIKNNTPVVVVGEISEYRDIKIKNGTMTGQIMGSFQLTDESGHCDCVIFPKELSLYEGALYDGNVILAHGKKGNRGGIIIEKIFEI